MESNRKPQDLSPEGFRKLLRDELEGLVKRDGKTADDQKAMGYAFQRWCAELYSDWDQGFDDVDPDEAVLRGAGDLKADFLFEDSTRKHLVIGQCKYSGRNRDVDEDEVASFFDRDDFYRDRNWILEHGSARAIDLLQDYKEKVEQGYKVSLLFFSTAKASERVKQLTDTKNREYEQSNREVECRLFDLSELKAFYVKTLSQEASIPDKVTISLPKNHWIHMDKPYPTIAAVVKGNLLRNLYAEHREALFAYNIRGYLGDRGINADISRTARDHPKEFFYFNNGISAVCTNLQFDRTSGELIASKFQIINGAQTVVALNRAGPNPSVEVLLRVTESQAVATEKGFNQNIIRYNNSQNVVKVSDFRANDPIQNWLTKQFDEYKGKFSETLPSTLSYAPKRGIKKGGRYAGTSIRLEEVAKIRYAFCVEPTLGLESPKELWTRASDKGKYDTAFGIDGKCEPYWTNDVFEELLLAIALYYFLNKKTKEEAATNPKVSSLNRLKYHALAMAGMYYRANRETMSAKKILSNKNRFEDFCHTFWTAEARKLLLDAYVDAEENNTTIYAMSRNGQTWNTLRKKFCLHLSIPD